MLGLLIIGFLCWKTRNSSLWTALLGAACLGAILGAAANPDNLGDGILLGVALYVGLSLPFRAFWSYRQDWLAKRSR